MQVIIRETPPTRTLNSMELKVFLQKLTDEAYRDGVGDIQYGGSWNETVPTAIGTALRSAGDIAGRQRAILQQLAAVATKLADQIAI